MNLLQEIRNDARGAAVLAEWIGSDGAPVPQWRAESRAGVCIGCPLNSSPKWWETAKHKIADAIKEHLALKNRLGLTVPRESALHMCRACGCCLPLLVHTPIIHIAHHTSGGQLEALPDYCWKKHEIKEVFQHEQL